MGEPTVAEPTSKRVKVEVDADDAPEAKKVKLENGAEASSNGSSELPVKIKMETGEGEPPVQIKMETGEEKEVPTAEERGDPDLEEMVVRQVEYYFGDFNLPRDKFLQEQIKLDDGWIPFDVMLKFKRLTSLSKNVSTISSCLKKSSTLMEISEDGKKLRRLPTKPLPAINDEWHKQINERTVYCKGFPITLTDIDFYMKFFKPYGPVENITCRRYLDRSTKKMVFKGSLFVLFKTKELAEKFLAVESVKYEDKELIRMTHAAHSEEKALERNERWGKKVKKEKGNKDDAEDNEKEETKGKKDLAKGCILKFSDIKDEDLSREIIKTTLVNLGADVAFIQFSKGEKEALVRLQSSEEGAANKFIQKLSEKGEKVKFGEQEMEVLAVEGEEEEEFLKKTREQMEKTQKNFKDKKGHRGGRRGGHRGGFRGHRGDRNSKKGS